VKIRKRTLFFWLAPLGLLAICALSFGALASKLGYYWDDWTIVWYIHFLGSGIFKEAFAGDRPLLAWIYIVTTGVIGENPLYWQVFAIMTRWLACVALWIAMRGLWPQKPIQTTAIAVLFALYPGFRQGYIAITYGNAFIVLAIYLASWALMIWSVRIRKWFWLLFLSSIILALYSVFTAEHFFGLELLRPVMLWIVLKEQANEGEAKRNYLPILLKLWTPFAAIDLGFLAWRLRHPTPRAEITFFTSLRHTPLGTISQLIQTVVQDIFTSSVLAWKQVFSLRWLADYPQSVTFQYGFVLFAVATGTVFVLLIANKSINPVKTRNDRKRWAFQSILFGLFGLFVGGIPIWPTNLRIGLDFPWDRFTLPMMVGAALLLVGLIELISVFRYGNIILVAALAGLAGGMHYQNARAFQADWLAQRDYFWQLSWRAPGIEPGTILLTSEMPFQFDWDNSLTAPLNWTYAPDFEGRELPYLMYNAESRLSSGLPDLEKSTRISEELRITPFTGSISRTILAFYRPPGACLNVIDPQRDRYLPDKPRFFKDIYSLSVPSLILNDVHPAAQPPLAFFGPEPAHDWCYFYAKAELARQFHDWEAITKLGEHAFQINKQFVRKNASELLPFIEGYARMGYWQRSYELTVMAYHAWQNMRLSLCSLWGSLESKQLLNNEGRITYTNVKETIACKDSTP